MKVELSKFKVKKGMAHKVDEWLNFLNQNMEKVLLTLNDEKMYVETIFREISGEDEYLYWYSIQGEDGTQVESSEHEVDKKHLKYWYECIDEDFKHINMETKVVMIPNKIRNLMT